MASSSDSCEPGVDGIAVTMAGTGGLLAGAVFKGDRYEFRVGVVGGFSAISVYAEDLLLPPRKIRVNLEARTRPLPDGRRGDLLLLLAFDGYALFLVLSGSGCGTEDAAAAASSQP